MYVQSVAIDDSYMVAIASAVATIAPDVETKTDRNAPNCCLKDKRNCFCLLVSSVNQEILYRLSRCTNRTRIEVYPRSDKRSLRVLLCVTV